MNTLGRRAAITMYDNHAAVNVKVHGRLACNENADDLIRERAWDITVAWFWECAGILAHKRGYAQVFSEGRSGGWCVPFYQQTSAGVTRFERWPGYGGELGQPYYPDVIKPGEREKFRAFERDIKRLLEKAREEYAHFVELELEGVMTV